MACLRIRHIRRRISVVVAKSIVVVVVFHELVESAISTFDEDRALRAHRAVEGTALVFAPLEYVLP
jgi:hypothetical protein